MLTINDKRFEKGQKSFGKKEEPFFVFRGEVDKYGWVDIGSSFCHLKSLLHSYGLNLRI
jgi:hypothetical protein